MATAAQINAIADIILAAFNNDATAFEAFLIRAAKQTELARINSQITNLQAVADASAVDYGEQLAVLSATRAAKQAEIDALPG